MAINPADITTVRVDQLASEPITLTSLLPHQVGTDLKQDTVQALVDLVATAIGAGSGVGYLPISVTDGQQLSAVPADPSFFLCGAGTFLNINGFPNVVCTGELNAVMSLPDHWELAVEIPIVAEIGVQTVTGSAVDNTDPLNPIINLTGVATVTGTAVDNTDPDNPIIDISTISETSTAGQNLNNNLNFSLYAENNAGDILDVDISFGVITITNIDGTYQGISKQGVFASDNVGGSPLYSQGTILKPKGVNRELSSILKTQLEFEDPTGLGKIIIPDVVNTTKTIAFTSDIPTIDATPTDGSANAVSSNGVFDALALKADQSTTPKTIIRIITPSTALTGTTSETQITSFNFTIPANTFSANDILKVETIAWEKSGVANASSCRLKLSNTNNYAGASNVLILAASGGNINMRSTRTYKIAGGNLKGFMSSSANGIFNDNTLSSVAVSTLALDVTQPIYGFVSLQNSSSADSTIMNELIISKW
jgi:hypothetical protein